MASVQLKDIYFKGLLCSCIGVWNKKTIGRKERGREGGRDGGRERRRGEKGEENRRRETEERGRSKVKRLVTGWGTCRLTAIWFNKTWGPIDFKDNHEKKGKSFLILPTQGIAS